MNRILVIFILFYFCSSGSSQNCKYSISGRVLDESTSRPLDYVNIFIKENLRGTVTNIDGDFLIEGVCAGTYHLEFTHIGCASQELHLDLERDTILNIVLDHTSNQLGTIVVEDKSSYDNQPSQIVNRQVILDNLDSNLSDLLENKTGVHILRSGNTIGKPIVHGMYGNRLTILNNGIPQSGQQWGNDHSPEIDPLTANKITVLKGSNALTYAGTNLGSIILVEPSKIGREPHLHGHLGYGFSTNGRGHTANLQMKKYSPNIAWKVNGTLKHSGDLSTPNYLLRNTGARETNLSLQLEKSWNENLFVDFYASTFNTTLGVLRGSHIGNTTDLQEALMREVPFFTNDTFTSYISAPRQEVSHHLFKLNGNYYLNDHQNIKATFSLQINDRKEFDVRRNERTNIPTLSILQYTMTSDIKFRTESDSGWNWELGQQNIYTDNTNASNTGVLPLIPDYLSMKSSAYVTMDRAWKNTKLDMGLRYDYDYQNAVTIRRTTIKEIIRYTNQFHNISGVATGTYDISTNQSLSLSTGYAARNPAINELYSSGLHQGVSGIEEGDINLETEQSLKTTLEYSNSALSGISFNALIYSQWINNYIFLNPQDEIRLTIRGAFPVFTYDQTDAHIYGLDLSTQINISHDFIGQVKYSYIRGKDRGGDIPLINMPPQSIYGSIVYKIPSTIKVKSTAIDDIELKIDNRYVFEQKNLLPSQDFVLPPDAYNLVGFKLSSNIKFPQAMVRFFINMENIFNTKYRDYLNRQRYFADDLGRNITMGARWKF